jgi:hypothetical protein
MLHYHIFIDYFYYCAWLELKTKLEILMLFWICEYCICLVSAYNQGFAWVYGKERLGYGL